jgi:hypothetical protein
MRSFFPTVVWDLSARKWFQLASDIKTHIAKFEMFCLAVFVVPQQVLRF